jgi:hypothetical protein
MVVSGSGPGVVAAGAVLEIAEVVFEVVKMVVVAEFVVAEFDPPAFATAQPLTAVKRKKNAKTMGILGDFTASFTVFA